MKRISPKTAARKRQAQPVRDALIERVGRCEVCLKPRMADKLCCHEIARGVHRTRCLDKPFGILVVCREPNWHTGVDCHSSIQNWPEAKQLALLYCVRASDFDLPAYCNMVNERAPNRITWDEVSVFISQITALEEVRG